MKTDVILPSNDGKINLSMTLYQPENPKATIQFLHGMSGYGERYDRFHRFLMANGYAVIAPDIRGHGDSINDYYIRGHMDDFELIVDDQLVAYNYMHEMYPDLPHYSVSHSFGSMTMRVFMQEHDDLFDKMVFTGAPHYVTAVEGFSRVMAEAVVRTEDEYFVPERGTAFVHRMMETYPERYYPNEETFIAFRSDDRMTGTYTLRGLQVIVDMLVELGKLDQYQVKNPDLQILSVSGTEDRLSGSVTDVKNSMEMFRDMGYKKVIMSIYPNMKHEILYEKHPFDIVYHDILRFLDEE